MTDAAKRLSTAAKSLSPGDRLELVEQLLDSLDAPDSAIDKLWAAEAEDRLSAYRRGEIEAMSLADVLAKYTSS
jgi:putative addiction module component (TIGR02574 family)